MRAAEHTATDEAFVVPTGGLLPTRPSLDRFDLACAGRLQQDQAVARSLLCILIALSLVFSLQVSPLIRIYGLEVSSLEFAIRCRLRGKQRRVRSPNSWLRISNRFRVAADTYGRTGGRRLDFAPGDIEFTRRRIARATGNRNRAKDSADRQEFWREQNLTSTKRCTNDGHVNNSELTRALLEHQSKMQFRRVRQTWTENLNRALIINVNEI